MVGPASGQPFEVPCPASASVLAMYRNDADRLALDRTYRNGTAWEDSIAIDPDWAATAMNALVAVHNSTLPARDTVVDMLFIHVFPFRSLRSLMVRADSTLPWMEQLQQGNIPTGTPAIDELMADYGITVTDYFTWPWLGGDHMAVLSTGFNVNVLPLCALFMAQPGVADADPNGVCCDGSTIADSVHTDHVNLLYSLGWGDCFSGCIFRRYWEFNVLPDCTVEYVGSYGAPLNLPTSTPEHLLPALRLHPNPAEDQLHIDGLNGPAAGLLYTMDGRLVMTALIDGGSLSIGELSPGMYVLRLPGEPALAPAVFVKL